MWYLSIKLNTIQALGLDIPMIISLPKLNANTSAIITRLQVYWIFSNFLLDMSILGVTYTPVLAFW